MNNQLNLAATSFWSLEKENANNNPMASNGLISTTETYIRYVSMKFLKALEDTEPGILTYPQRASGTPAIYPRLRLSNDIQ